MNQHVVNEGQSIGARIAGRLATGGLGLVLGSIAFTAFMFYQWWAADLVMCDGKYGPIIWGLDGFQVAMHGLLLPLVFGVVGLLVPLGRIRPSLSHVPWAVILVVLGALSIVICWGWTIFVMYCWFMACPG